MVKINGEHVDAAGKTISQYLEDAEYETKYVVVERNEEILPRDCYDTTVLEDGDEIEIVRFMGGGSR